MQHRPLAIGLVVCEHVIVEAITNNVTPVNCFAARKVKTLPTQIPFTVLGWISNGMGNGGCGAALTVQHIPVEIRGWSKNPEKRSSRR